MDLVTSLCGRSPFIVGILATTTGEINNAFLPKPNANPPKPSNKMMGRKWQPLSRRLKPRIQNSNSNQQGDKNNNSNQMKAINIEKLKAWEKVALQEAEIQNSDNNNNSSSNVRKGQWRAIRVFISSTFVDTHGERDMLIRHVFPEVNKLLRSHYVRIIPIDLRWGINDTHNIQSTCLDYIDQCRGVGSSSGSSGNSVSNLPWFISLRTQRYGWVQTRYQNPQDFAHPENLLWLKEFDLNSIPLSITNMEVYHAFLGRERKRLLNNNSSSSVASESENESESEEDSESDSGSEYSRSSYSSEGSGSSVYSGGSDEAEEEDDYERERGNNQQQQQQQLQQQQQQKKQQVPHSFFLFRNEKFMEQVPRDRQWIFDFEYRLPKDPSISASMRDQYIFDPQTNFYKQQFLQINQAIRESDLPKVIYDYNCVYESSSVSRATNSGTGKNNNYLQGFGKVAQLDLLRAFLVKEISNSVMYEYPSQGVVDRRTTENAAHFTFMEEKCLSFVGREDVLNALNTYCFGQDGGEKEGGSMFVLTGEPGAGKSTVLAKFVLDLQEREERERGGSGSSSSLIVLSHFVGASANSNDLHMLLTRLCNELKILCPKEVGESVVAGTDFAKLSMEWISVFLAKAATTQRGGRKNNHNNSNNYSNNNSYRGEKKIIIVLDDLDSLSEMNSAHSLAWLPKELPKNVKLIFSCEKDGVVHENIENIQENAQIHELLTLPLHERSLLVSSYLSIYNKSLTTSATATATEQTKGGEKDKEGGGGQMSLLLNKTQATSPLFLVIASDALRRFGVYEKLTEYIIDLPKTVPSLLRYIIQDLENTYGLPVIKTALSLIACARSGLLESDIVVILDSLNLTNDNSNGKSSGSGSNNCTWGVLFESMKGFLSGGETGCVRFFHNEIKKIIEDRYSIGPRYVTEEKNVAIHLILANYFLTICEKEMLQPNSQANAEYAFDIIYYLLHADQGKKARMLLLRMDFLFLRVKYGGPVSGLLQDIEMFLKFFPRDKTINILGIGVVLSCHALSIDYKQLPIQLQARLIHMYEQYKELETLLNRNVWSTNTTHPVRASFLSVVKPGGPEITRINRVRLPLDNITQISQFHLGVKYCFGFLPNGRIGVNSFDGGFKICELVGHTKEVYGLLTFGQLDENDSGSSSGSSSSSSSSYGGSSSSNNNNSSSISGGAVSWGNDMRVCVWDLQAALKGRRDIVLRYQVRMEEHVMGCAVVYGESIVVIWTAHKVYVWPLGKNVIEISLHTERLVGGYVLPGAERKGSMSCKFVSYSRDHNLIVYDLLSISNIKTTAAAAATTSAINATVVTTANLVENIHYFVLSGHTNWVLGVTQIQKSLLSWSRDGVVKIWSSEKEEKENKQQQQKQQQQQQQQQYTQEDLSHVFPSPIINAYVFNKKQTEIFIWDSSTQFVYFNFETKKTYLLLGHAAQIEGVTVSQDEEYAISYGRDRTMCLWDLKKLRESLADNSSNDSENWGGEINGDGNKTTECCYKMKGHDEWVMGVIFLEESKYALSWSRDKKLLLWDLATVRKQAASYFFSAPVLAKKPKLKAPIPPPVVATERGGGGRRGGRGGRGGGGSSRKKRGGNRGGGRRIGEKKRQPLDVRPFVKIKGHTDWVRGVCVFRNESFLLSFGGSELMIWNLEEIKKVLEQSIDKTNQEGFGNEKQKQKKLSRTIFVPVPLLGHPTRIQHAYVYVSSVDSTYHAFSYSKDKTVIEWSLDIAQDEGRKNGKELTLKKALYAEANELRKKARLLQKEYKKKLANGEIKPKNGRQEAEEKEKKEEDDDEDEEGGEGGEKKEKEKKKQKGEEGEEEVEKPLLFANSLGHTKWVTGVKFFKDNTRVITYGKDSRIVLWDVTEKNNNNNESSSSSSSSSSSDSGSSFLTVSDRHMLTLSGHTDMVRGILFLEKGKKIISWSKDNTIIVWNFSSSGSSNSNSSSSSSNSSREEQTFSLVKLQGHTDIILGCRLLDKETKLLSFSRDKTIRIWDLTNLQTTPTPLVILGENEQTAHTAWIRGVNMCMIQGQGEKFLSYADDAQIKIWDALRAREEQKEVLDFTLEGHQAKILGCLLFTQLQTQTFSKKRDYISHCLTFSADNMMILWDLTNSLQTKQSVCMQLVGHTDWVIGAKLLRIPTTHSSRLLNRLLSWSRDGCMRLWDLGNLNESLPSSSYSVCEFQCELGIIASVVVSRNASSILCSGADSNDILIWDLKAIVSSQEPWVGRRSRFTSSLQGHTLPPTRLTLFSADTRLLSVDKQTIMVWDLINSVSLWTLTLDTPISICASALGFADDQEVVIDGGGENGGEADGEGEPEEETAIVTSGENSKKIPGLSQLFIGHTDGTVSHVFVRQ